VLFGKYKQELFIGILLWFLVLLAVASAARAGFSFHATLPEPHNVEFTVRYSDVEHFATRAGLTVEETLTFLKEQGVTSIGVFEQTLWGLRRANGCHVLSNLELAGELAFNPGLARYENFIRDAAGPEGLRLGDYIVLIPGGPWAEQVWEHLGQLRVVENPAIFRLSRAPAGERELFLIRGANYDNLPHLALGTNPGQLEKVSAAGLLVNPYLAARSIETSFAVEQALSTFDGADLSAVVFEGGLVPGFPRFTAETAAALAKRGLTVALYEYNQYPQGMKELAAHLQNSPVVMLPGKNWFPSLQEVFNGVRERKVQLVELQIRDFGPRLRGEELRDEFSRKISSVQQFLIGKGYNVGRLHQFAVGILPLKAYLVMGLGLVAFTLLLLRIFLPIRPVSLLILLIAAAAALFPFFCWNRVTAGQVLALWTALVFPLYAVCSLLSASFPVQGSPDGHGAGPRPGVNMPGFFARAGLRLGGVFLLSLAGGLLLHGLLTQPPFFCGLEFFRGVKIMYALPLIVAGFLVLVCQDSDVASAGASRYFFCPLHPGRLGKPCLVFVRRLLLRPVVLRDLLILGLLLALAYVYLLRTGHVMAVSPLESWERDILERLLGVRPRLKEFLLGYPPALLGLYFLQRQAKGALRLLAFIFLAAGVLVPISVLNTFAHVQAPVWLSICRSVHGFWLGALCGLLLLLLIWAVDACLRWRNRG
jgi:hypothetical protein